MVSVEARQCPGCGQPLRPGELEVLLLQREREQAFVRRAVGAVAAFLVVLVGICVMGFFVWVAGNTLYTEYVMSQAMEAARARRDAPAEAP